MRAMLAHRPLLWLLTLVPIATSAGVRAGGQDADVPQQSALDAKPAGLPLPRLPGAELDGEPVAPEPRRLARDGALADRFTAPAQRVRYPFSAAAGELSLFELSAAGYARGWSSAAALRVLDAEGRTLAERTLDGGVLLHLFLPFQAPVTGEYALEVGAEREYFRYALVRHSTYAPHANDRALRIGERVRVHGWLADGADRARYVAPVRAGQELVLSLEGSREPARAERRRLAAEQADGVTMAGMRRSAARMSRDQGRPRPSRRFPQLRLQLDREGAVAARGPAFAVLAPEDDGWVEITVTGLPGEPGGLFDLVLRRDVVKHAVHGVVVDDEDELLPGVDVLFRLEPDLEPWARTTTDAEGAYSVRLPPGDFRVELRRPGVDRAHGLRAGISAATELNLLWRGP